MRTTIVCLFLMTSACSCFADGKVYDGVERVPPNIPYQRALIIYQDGKESLFLQSRFELSGANSTNSVLGWVVPVPSVPELDSMTSSKGTEIFSWLSFRSRPVGVELKYVFIPLGAACLVSLLVFLASPLIRRFGISLHVCGIEFYAILTACLFVFFAFAILFIPAGMRGSTSGVDVLRAGQVGIYDTAVIHSDNNADLIAWLDESGFNFTPSDMPVVDRYIQAGWCFVVAKVRPEEKSRVSTRYGGLIDPIILRFQTKTPVYPLALTSTIGGNTEVLIYFLSDGKMKCDNRMKRHFTGILSEDFRNNVFVDAHFLPWEKSLPYLCKFKGKLSPEQMKTDLEFSPASDNKPHRGVIFRW